MTVTRSLVEKIKRNIIINMSKVSETNADDAEKIAKVKDAGIKKNFAGKHPGKIEKETEVRKITNGSDTYYTGDGVFTVEYERFFGDPRNYTPATVRSTIRNFAVLHNEESAFMSIRQNETLTEGYEKVAPYEITLPGEKVMEFSEPIDINNINSIRYAVKDNEKASFFLDKYFIVSQQEKENYAVYKKQRLKEEQRIQDQQRAKQKELALIQKQAQKIQKRGEQDAERQRHISQRIQAQYNNRFFGK